MNILGQLRRLVVFVVTVVWAAGWCGSAQALNLSCTFSITNMNFGTIDLTANTVFNTTATLSISCTGSPFNNVRVCPNIGGGSGGVASGGDPRYMLNGGTQLKYNIFQDAAYSTVWGSVLWSYPTIGPPTIDVPLTAGGTGSATVTLYGRVYASQQTLVPGTYSSSFGAADVQIAYKQVGNQTCSQIGSSNAVAASFTVTANYAPSCRVAATTLNFGSTGFLSASIDGSSTLTPTCSASTPYTVALNGGNSGATDPTQRKMSSGAAQVIYGLYRDSARTLPWGSTAGVDTIAGTGSGFGQTLNIYGRVPSQTTPAPGTYSDTIIATITY